MNAPSVFQFKAAPKVFKCGKNDLQIKSEICGLIKSLNEKAKQIWGREFKNVTIDFSSLKGKVAGLAYANENLIKFNWDLLTNNYEYFLSSTVSHELAHLIAYQLYGKRAWNHGVEWKNVMRALGGIPKTYHKLDTNVAGVKRFSYKCNCQTFQVTPNIHNKMIHGQKRVCKKCWNTLVFVPAPKITWNN